MTNKLKSDIDLSLEEEILRSYPPDLLDDIFKKYFEAFLSVTDKYFTIWSIDKKEFEGLTVRKREIARLLAITLSDEEIFTAWIGQLPYMVFKVLETITWEGKKTILELDARTKGNILIEKDLELKKINRDYINQDYCLFLLSIHKHLDFVGNPLVYLDLPASIRKKCKRYLPKPKGYFLKGIKSLEKTKYEFCDKGRILDAFSVIKEFINQGHLKGTKSGMLKKQSLARLSQQSGLEEFFTEADESNAKLLRIELTAFMINSICEDLEEEALDSLKLFISRFSEADELSLIRFLDHVKGWYHASKFLQIDYNREFLRLVRELPLENWVSIRQLNRFITVRGYNLLAVDEEACRYLHISGNWEGWGNKRHSLAPRHFSEIIIQPLLQTYLFLFAALGMLDIRYDSPRSQITLPDGYSFSTIFDGLKYLRLTSLGAYILELTDCYSAENRQGVSAELDLDEDRLIVSLSTTDARIELLLEQVAQRIGRLRFKVDFESFLKGCEDEDDVINRINRFISLVGDNIPDIWKDFLLKIKQRSTSITLDDRMQIYVLNSEDKELIDLITNDEELRRIVLLAEDYRILVFKKDIIHFQKRMLIFGYLF